MTIERTELEWLFSPPDFFEAPYRWQTDHYALVAAAGKVLVTLATSADPVDPELHARMSADIEGLFRLRQLQVHRPFQLEGVRIYQHHPGGRKSVSIGVDCKAVLVSGGQADSVVRDASGAIVKDTKAERIADHTRFIDSVMPKLAGSPRLRGLLQSYNAAVDDAGNELVHLYEIRDALAEHYGGEDAARAKLGISKKEWQRFGILANVEPLIQGRHRGKYTPGSRPATATELDEARVIVRRWIGAFASQV
jgi:hypothetical protein